MIFQVSGRRSKFQPDPTPPREKGWPALDRTDFLLVVKPFQDSSLLIDPDKLIDAFLDARMGNAFTYWTAHVWYNTPPPTASQLKHWGVAMLWYFFTEDIFNPKQQRDWGFATVDDYNLDLSEQILETGRVLGKDRALWGVGHEQMDQVRGWPFQADGTKEAPKFQSKHEGYEFYRKWITTTVHIRHWMEYGNTRPAKFFDGWNTGGKATWEFLADHKLDTAPVTMLSGGVSPVLAHASFDILPRIGMYWWECVIDGASLQVGAAYAEGAARQYNKKWLMDVSQWSRVNGSPGWGYVDGKWTGGATDDLLLRSWLYGYLSGAAVVLEENSGSTHFRIDPYPNGPSDRPIITSTGETAQKAARFCFELCPDRGEPYRPVAVLLEHEHGFEPRPKTNFRLTGPWGYMPMGEGEYEIERFWYSAFPSHSSAPAKSPDPRASENLILTESAFGDIFEVVTDRASLKTLSRYPRLMTLGGIQIGKPLLARLREYVQGGGEILVSAAHLSSEVAGDPLFRNPKVRVMPARWQPATADFLKKWIEPVWPVVVSTASGHAPQVLLNRLRDGWLVTIGNHRVPEWRGTIAFRSPVESVTDVWTQSQSRHDGRAFQAAVPSYAFGVYRVRNGWR